MNTLPILLSAALSVCVASAAQAQEKPAAYTTVNPVPSVDRGTATTETQKVVSVDYWTAIGAELQGIKEAYLDIYRPRELRLGTVFEKNLRTTIESRCKAVGLKIVQSRSNMPILTVCLAVENHGWPVCHVGVDLAVPIAPKNNNNKIPIVCNKWSNSAELSGSLGSDQDVTSTAVSAIDYFLKAWKAVNPR